MKTRDIFLIIFISFCTSIARIESKNSILKSCDVDLPKKCNLIDYMEKSLNTQIKNVNILCESDDFDKQMLEEFTRAYKNCSSLKSSTLYLSIKSSRGKIVDESFGIFQLGLHLTSEIEKLKEKFNYNHLIRYVY